VIGRFINLIREEGVSVRVRKSGSVSPDPGDDPFCACAAQGDASFLVTLNPRDFPQQQLDAKIIHPGENLPPSRKKRSARR
jgi:predicted nucleic acid-binding protein